MLKYEGKFEIGQRIRAYDYNPDDMDEGTHVYVEGVIEKILDEPWRGYLITVDVCTHMGRTGQPVLVPMERDRHEFDNRVMLVKN